MSGSRTSRIGALLLVLPACAANGGPIDLGSGEGDLVIAAVFRSSEGASQAQVRSARIVSGATPFSVEPGEQVATFRIPRADLFDPTGRPLDDATIAAVTARALGEEIPAERGDCGRCLATSPAPVTVHPGDLCVVPENAAVQVDGVEARDVHQASLLRKQVRLAWPGACACREESSTPSPPPPAFVIAPAANLRGYRHVSVDDRGAVLAASLGTAHLYAAGSDGDGEVALSTGHRELSLVAPLPPIPAHDASFVAAYQSSRIGLAAYDIINLDGDRVSVTPSDAAPDVLGEAWVLADDQLFHLGSAAAKPSAGACRYDGVLRCTTEDPCPEGCVARRFDAGAKLATGLVAGGTSSELFHRADDTKVWTRADLEANGAGETVDKIDHLAADGDRVFICAILTDGQDRRGAVLTASVGPGLSGTIRARELLDLGRAANATTCAALLPAAPGTGALMWAFNGGHEDLLTLDSRGVRSRWPLRAPFDSTMGIVTSRAGWLAAVTRSGGVVRASSLSASPEVLAGSSTRSAMRSPGLATSKEGAYVLGPDRRLARVRLLHSPPAAPSDLIWDATPVTIPVEPTLIHDLVASTPEGHVLRAAILSDGATTRFPVEVIEPSTGQRLYASDEAPAHTLSIPGNGGAYRAGDVAAPWSDAAVIVVREGPVLGWERSTGVRLLSPGVGAARAALQSAGVVWILGSEGAARVRAGSGRLIVEPPLAFAELPLMPERTGERDLSATAGRAICPDTLRLFGNNGARSALFALCTSADCAGSGGQTDEPRLVELAREGAFLPRDDRTAVVGPPHGLIGIDDWGVMVTTSGEIGQLPFLGPYQVAEQPSWALIAAAPAWVGLLIYSEGI